MSVCALCVLCVCVRVRGSAGARMGPPRLLQTVSGKKKRPRLGHFFEPPPDASCRLRQLDDKPRAILNWQLADASLSREALPTPSSHREISSHLSNHDFRRAAALNDPSRPQDLRALARGRAQHAGLLLRRPWYAHTNVCAVSKPPLRVVYLHCETCTVVPAAVPEKLKDYSEHHAMYAPRRKRPVCGSARLYCIKKLTRIRDRFSLPAGPTTSLTRSTVRTLRSARR